uniref:Uncharacterized protein n=1 Tax=Anguilla anguilla TaxID=7936 RepID=A0A0E9RFU5_ANGAN
MQKIIAQKVCVCVCIVTHHAQISFLVSHQDFALLFIECLSTQQ